MLASSVAGVNNMASDIINRESYNGEKHKHVREGCIIFILLSRDTHVCHIFHKHISNAFHIPALQRVINEMLHNPVCYCGYRYQVAFIPYNLDVCYSFQVSAMTMLNACYCLNIFSVSRMRSS